MDQYAERRDIVIERETERTDILIADREIIKIIQMKIILRSGQSLVIKREIKQS